MKKSRSIIRRILSSSLFLINIGVVIWLMLCYAASVVNPSSIRYLTLFSLTTPFAILANVFFVAFWLFSTHKLRSIFSVIFLAFCARMIPAIFGYHYFSENDWSKANRSFKLMSWNVHAMGTFNHPNEKWYGEGVIETIKNESPDILCLPEFAINADPKKRTNVPRILKDGRYKEYHFNVDNGYGTTIMIGTAFFSRYKVEHYKAYELSPYIFLLECDVQMQENKILRICVVHLQSFGLSDKDKALIEEVKQRNTESISKSKPFAWKFNQAYIERGLEADQIDQIIRRSPYPVLLCGDFNDLPYSYTYTKSRGELTDAFTKMGRGFGRTYNQIIPTLRIDHIFYDDKALNLKAFETVYSPHSDHSPVIANFEWK